MKLYRKLWTDDLTGRYSGTTLRTWMLFLIFFLFALTLAVLSLAWMAGLGVQKPDQDMLSLLYALGIFCLGGQSLYLGKRFIGHDYSRGPSAGDSDPGVPHPEPGGEDK